MLAMPNIATVFKAETARIARKDVRAEVVKWRRVVKDAGLTAE